MSEARLSAGTHVGPYEVLGLLGRGGMGEVYRARDLRLSREVALKALHADVSSDPDRLRRFEQEARAAGMLNHPNIVAVYDIAQSGGSPYIVEELLLGETLGERLLRGPLPARKALDYALQIARGLAAAHEKGVVHRDLKPDNVFVTKDGVVKILDFGIAKLARTEDLPAGTEAKTASHGTSPGTILGTLGYMSPEQVRGLATDHRSDFFSLGAVVFEMLVGRKAFRGSTHADTLSAILRENPAEGLVAEGAGESFVRILRRCLEKAPEERFQTACDLIFALGFVGDEKALPLEHATPSARIPHGVMLATVSGVGLAITIALWTGRELAPKVPPPSFQRLTFQLGNVRTARFAPDGETIVYSAQWGRAPLEVFTTRAAAPGSRSLGLKSAVVAAVSSQEEIAVLLEPRLVSWATYEGTLAKVPLSGGVPRELLEGVVAADWAPDGRELAVIHAVGERQQIEFPIGRVLYAPKPPAGLESIRVSPGGDKVAFYEHPQSGYSRGDLRMVDLQGRVTTLAQGLTAISELAWSRDGQEVWFGSSRKGGSPQQVLAVTVTGRSRSIAEVAGNLAFLDMSPTRTVLCGRGTAWTEMRARPRGSQEEVELAGADLNFLSDLTPDGQRVLGTDTGSGGGPNLTFFIQGTDGSAPVRLGEGDGQALSPDGRSALAILAHASPPQLMIVPTGAGETRKLEGGLIARYERAVWEPSGRKVVFAGAEPNQGTRLYVQEAAGGKPQPVTPEGVTLPALGRPVSPDGAVVVAVGPDGVPALYSLRGGEPRIVPGLGYFDRPVSWTADGRGLFVVRYDESPPRVDRVEIATGRAHPWTRMGHALPSGTYGDYGILITPDGESYAYNYVRTLSDLYLASGFP